MWFTAILNKLLAAPVAHLMLAAGQTPADPVQPIPNYMGMEILAILIILAMAMVLKRRLSVENPGAFQLLMEEVVTFARSTAEEIIGHDGLRYTALLGTLFITVLVCNVMGLIPTLETPTGHIQVTLGFSVAAFLYYNYHGVRHHGVLGYLKHLSGPMLALAVIMFPIEVIGNVGRLLSLSVRLYANMYVGDILDRVFTGLVPIGVPVIFDALHLFVSLLQAYIFMLLPAIYLSMALMEEH
jgi:F-type H+-transporting ATPase subunit a